LKGRSCDWPALSAFWAKKESFTKRFIDIMKMIIEVLLMRVVSIGF
jgi:hypothetical protein